MRCWRLPVILGILITGAWLARADTSTETPSVSHGIGAVVGGVLFDAPKTLLEIAAPIPPLVTAGIVAGLVRGAQVAFHGLQEVNEAFDPWGAHDHPQSGMDTRAPANATSYTTPGAQPDAY